MGVVANADGSVTTRFDLGDSGGSGLARARVVAVREGSAGSRNQKTQLDAAASGQDVVVSSDLGGNPGSNRAYTFAPGRLRHYSKYFFYLACQDAQGWFNAPPGSTAAIGAAGQATGAAISNNGGLVYDPTPPSILVTDVRARTDGGLRVTYNLSESGNSQLSGARIVASTAAMTRNQVFAASGASVANVTESGAVVSRSGQVVTLAGLTGWTAYRVYFAARDNQGWYDSGSFSGGNALSRAIDSNGGRTWDPSRPAISITNMQFTDPGNSNTLRVTVSIADTGNSGIERATIFLRESGGSNPGVSQDTVLFGSGGGQRANVLTNTTSNYSNSLQHDFALEEYTQYHAYVAIRDNQGNYDGSFAAADGNYDPVPVPLNVAGQAIPNGGRTYDLTAPSLNANPGMSMASGSSVSISWSGASDSMSGLASVKLLATTSASALSSAYIASAADSGSAQRVATSASASGTVTVAGLQAGATVYGWAASVDNQGNVSAARRTSPASVVLDNTPPTVSVAVQSVASSSAQLRMTASDAGSGLNRGHVGVFVNGYTPTTDAHFTGGNGSRVAVRTGAASGTWYTLSGLAAGTNYDAYAFAIDNVGLFRVSSRVDFMTASPPSINSFGLTSPSPETLRFAWNVSDANGDLASVRFFVDGGYLSGQNRSIGGGSSASSKDISVGAGTHSGYIVVYDGGGLSAQSSTVSGVSVAAVNVVPDFSLDSTSGAWVYSNGDFQRVVTVDYSLTNYVAPTSTVYFISSYMEQTKAAMGSNFSAAGSGSFQVQDARENLSMVVSAYATNAYGETSVKTITHQTGTHDVLVTFNTLTVASSTSSSVTASYTTSGTNGVGVVWVAAILESTSVSNIVTAVNAAANKASSTQPNGSVTVSGLAAGNYRLYGYATDGQHPHTATLAGSTFTIASATLSAPFPSEWNPYVSSYKILKPYVKVFTYGPADTSLPSFYTSSELITGGTLQPTEIPTNIHTMKKPALGYPTSVDVVSFDMTPLGWSGNFRQPSANEYFNTSPFKTLGSGDLAIITKTNAETVLVIYNGSQWNVLGLFQAWFSGPAGPITLSVSIGVSVRHYPNGFNKLQPSQFVMGFQSHYYDNGAIHKDPHLMIAEAVEPATPGTFSDVWPCIITSNGSQTFSGFVGQANTWSIAITGPRRHGNLIFETDDGSAVGWYRDYGVGE